MSLPEKLPPLPADAVEANKERRRRIALRNGTPAKALTGMDLIRADALSSARANFEILLPRLSKFITDVVIKPYSESAWGGYNAFYDKVAKAAEGLAQLSGEVIPIPARLERAAQKVVEVKPGARPDVVIKDVRPGLPPGPVPVGTRDGIQTEGLKGAVEAARREPKEYVKDPWALPDGQR
jgi:hypothetical protein